ncbi:hypothetical protein P280DRAFT_286226 [Massarina eburnea CBS 473.64]|uniref:Uncharacterized protein n=1 Tax=Massarina eburnea CBS 473.64 TaxID=1395130 RepID=A0A6A6S3F6_9PLEO|nr:hypothetical protein P280DRAFT_286226 [Massarina eburnea CBS 473.64]
MSSPGQGPHAITPAARTPATPHSVQSIHSAVHAVGQGGMSGSPRPKPTDKPPKLKLKLRKLASNPVESSALQTSTPAPSELNPASEDAVDQHTSQVKAPRWGFNTPTTSEAEVIPPSKLAAKTTGSMNDPIDVDRLMPSSPHQFLKRPVSYFAPVSLQYCPPRPKLASKFKTPNGVVISTSQIGAHEPHDIYKTLAKKDVTPPGFIQLDTYAKSQIGRPSAPRPKPNIYSQNIKTLHTQQYGNRHTPYQDAAIRMPSNTLATHPYPYEPFTATYKTPINGYPVFTRHDEGEIRKRALQFVRDDSRPRPRKRRLSDDPDETSGSEHEDQSGNPATKNPHTPKRKMTKSTVSTPSTGASEDDLFDRNLNITELVEHAQLITAMLMLYPYSNDHRGLREELSMLMSVSNKRFDSWLVGEQDVDGDTERRRQLGTTRLSPTGLKNVAGPVGTQMDKGKSKKMSLYMETTNKAHREEKEAQEQRKREDDMRQCLSSQSSFWSTHGGAEGSVGTAGPLLSAHSEPGAEQSTSQYLNPMAPSPVPFSEHSTERASSITGFKAAIQTNNQRPLLPKPGRSATLSDPVSQETGTGTTFNDYNRGPGMTTFGPSTLYPKTSSNTFSQERLAKLNRNLSNAIHSIKGQEGIAEHVDLTGPPASEL